MGRQQKGLHPRGWSRNDVYGEEPASWYALKRRQLRSEDLRNTTCWDREWAVHAVHEEHRLDVLVMHRLSDRRGLHGSLPEQKRNNTKYDDCHDEQLLSYRRLTDKDLPGTTPW